jgi:hypothetical protein
MLPKQLPLDDRIETLAALTAKIRVDYLRAMPPEVPETPGGRLLAVAGLVTL